MTDTHTHLTEEPLVSHLDAVIARAREVGVDKFIIPGYNADSWERARELADSYDEIYYSVGLHPMFINERKLPTFEKESEKLVAVGEIGLDYYNGDANKREQIKLFESQMQLAKEKKLPVILHCRKAYDDLFEICKKYREINCVLHSCSCSAEQAKPFLKLGFYISFSGTVTRKNSRKVKRLAELVPLEKMILETDSPFIGTATRPVPSVEPAQLTEIILSVAEIKKVKIELVKNAVEANAKNLFKL